MTDTVRSASYFLNLLHPNIPNATPDATVMEAQLARDLIVSLSPLLGQYRVDGTTYAFTGAGIQAAINAASLVAGSAVTNRKPLWVVIAGGQGDLVITTPLQRASNVGVMTEPGTRLLLPASAAQTSIFSNTTTFTAGSLLNVGANRDTDTTTLVAGGVAAQGIVKGSYCRIADTTLAVRNEMNRVLDVSGDTITWEKPLSYNYTNADKVSRVITTLVNSPLAVNLYGNGNTGAASYGVYCEAALFTHYEDCYFEGFNGGNIQAGFYSAYGYENVYERMTQRDCGSATLAGLTFARDWDCTYRDLQGTNGLFNIIWDYAGRCNIYNPSADRGGTRGLKFQNCRDVDVYSPKASNSQNVAGTGIIWNGSATYNLNFYGPTIRGGVATGMSGGGDGADRVRVFEPVASGNVTQIFTVNGDTNQEVHYPGYNVGVVQWASGIVKGARAQVATTNAAVTTIVIIDGLFGITTVHYRVAGRRTGGAAGAAGDGAGYVRAFTMSGDGVSTASAVGAETAIATHESQAAWDCAVAVGGSGGAIQVTGAVNNNVSWEVEYDIIKVVA